MTRGSVDGLPALTWGRADRSELATVRQLRELGLRPGGSEPVAVLVFGHRRPDGPRPAIEYASLYRISEAAPKRTATPAQRAAIDKALAARRTCQECGQEQDYYLPTTERRCWPCSEAADSRGHDDTRDHDDHAERGAVDVVGDDESDGWRVEHDAAMRAEDPHRPVTEHDLAGPDSTGCDLGDPGAGDGSVAIPAQRTGPGAAAHGDTGTADDGAVTSTNTEDHQVLTSRLSAVDLLAATEDEIEPAGLVKRDPTPAAEETARAVGRAQHALTRIAQQRTGTSADLPPGAERARAGQLSRWHADDRAAAQRQHVGEHTDELEGISR